MPRLLSSEALSQAISLPDLTDTQNGNHAMQILVRDICTALAQEWNCRQLLLRTSPVVPLENNYDRLGYPPEGAARDERYTRYITDRLILRTQTSAAIPDLLNGLSIDPPQDLLLILPGIVYRRDSIDKLHCGEPHQLDLWRIVDSLYKDSMETSDLQQMISVVMHAALPGIRWRTIESSHPYTEQGVQIDVLWHEEWVEVGECGLASSRILSDANLVVHTGLAMGLGLDRLLMVRKNIPDIRLLRSQDQRVRSQLNNLNVYRPVSIMPAINRDLSICVDESLDEESIGDKVRDGLSEAEGIECLLIKSETAYENLPPSAHERMGMKPGQKNILLQITIRHMDRTLKDDEANAIRNEIYVLLHEGDKQELAINA